MEKMFALLSGVAQLIQRYLGSRKVLGTIPATVYPDMFFQVFSYVTPGKCRDGTLKLDPGRLLPNKLSPILPNILYPSLA